MSHLGLLDHLKEDGGVVVAEGYVREFERRGYLSAGAFIPVVVLEHPDLVRMMHEEFVHAGSDVVLAFTYYGHRDKLRHIGREDELEKLNRTALKIAREIADKTGCLMAGGICNSCVYNPEDPSSFKVVEDMFKEQIEWAVEEGADYIVGETFNDYGEAKLALESIQKYGKGLPAVITMAAYIPDVTTDDVPFPEACRKLEEAGAAVVGLNCARGPATMLPLIKEIRKACKGPIAAVPVPYRCTDESRTFQSLKDPVTGENLYPTNISCFECNRSDIRKFAQEAKSIGVKYIGVCCGNNGGLMREVAKVYGRKPEAAKYDPDMSLSYMFRDLNEQEKPEHLRKWHKFATQGKD